MKLCGVPLFLLLRPLPSTFSVCLSPSSPRRLQNGLTDKKPNEENGKSTLLKAKSAEIVQPNMPNRECIYLDTFREKN